MTYRIGRRHRRSTLLSGLILLAASSGGCSLQSHVGEPSQQVPEGDGLLLVSVDTDTPIKTLHLINTASGVDDTALTDLPAGHTVRLLQLPTGDYEWYRIDLPEVLSSYGVYNHWLTVNQGGRHLRFSVQADVVNYGGDLHFQSSPDNSRAVVVPQVNELGAYSVPDEKFLATQSDRLSIDLASADQATRSRIAQVGLRYSGPGADGFPAYLQTLPAAATPTATIPAAVPDAAPFEDYLRGGRFSRAVLNPDGQQVLVVEEHPGFSSRLLFVDLAARLVSELARSDDDDPFVGLRWLSDDTAIYFGAGDSQGRELIAIRWRRSADGVRRDERHSWYGPYNLVAPIGADGSLRLQALHPLLDPSKPVCLLTATLDAGSELLKMGKCAPGTAAAVPDFGVQTEGAVTDDAALSAAFPGRRLFLAGRSTDGKTVLVRVSDAAHDDGYYVYRDGQTPLRIGGVSDPTDTKVGTAIIAGAETYYQLTIPVPGQGPYPLVVIPERDDAGSRQSDGMEGGRRLLESHGYAVLSVRYPSGPQAPVLVAAAVRAVLAGGELDAERICIFGAGDGGYVALMSAIHDPGLYRCVASVAAVTDIPLLSATSYPQFVQDTRERLSKLAGASVDDIQAQQAASPVYLAAQIRSPVLLADGENDSVSSEQANRMKLTLDRLGRSVSYQPDRSGDAKPEDPEADFYAQLLAFLEQEDAAR